MLRRETGWMLTGSEAWGEWRGESIITRVYWRLGTDDRSTSRWIINVPRQQVV